MNILITGAVGFLGFHLSTNLIGKGHKIIGIDDLSSGSKQNLELLLNTKNFEFINHDVRVPYQHDVDFILNFACPASPVQYQIDPVKTIETSFYGMKNALDLALRLKVPLIQASTSEIYGDPLVSPQKEDYWGNVNPTGLRSCYDEGKRAAETLCFDFKRQYGVDVRVIHIFNTYGPNMSIDDGRVISNFICQALNGEEITIYGHGSQTRSFCYVSDLVEAIIKLISLPGCPSGPFNLGNPTPTSISEIAQTILEKTNSRSEIVYLELPSDDPKHRLPDISFAKSVLNWQPTIDISTGLDKTINYFKTLL